MTNPNKLADALASADAMESEANLHQTEDDHSGPVPVNPETLKKWAASFRAALAANPEPDSLEVVDAVRDVMHEVFKYADIAAPLRGPPMTQDESLPVRIAASEQDRIIRNMLYALATPRPAPAADHATCPVEPHAGSGYLHAPEHTGPYDVDGVTYCGRCHVFMSPQPAPCPCNEPTCKESWEPGCGLGNSREHAQAVHGGRPMTLRECMEAEEGAAPQPAPAPVQVEELAAKSGLPWRDISECEPSDDLYWFMRGDAIDGPRTPAGDDPDYWSHFARCEAPPFNRTAHTLTAAEDALRELPGSWRKYAAALGDCKTARAYCGCAAELKSALVTLHSQQEARGPAADCAGELPLATGSAELAQMPELPPGYALMLRADYDRAIASLRQPAHVSDAMVERACKRYAFREDGAKFPDDYSEYEVLAERKLMRDLLTHAIIASQQESRND